MSADAMSFIITKEDAPSIKPKQFLILDTYDFMPKASQTCRASTGIFLLGLISIKIHHDTHHDDNNASNACQAKFKYDDDALIY